MEKKKKELKNGDLSADKLLHDLNSVMAEINITFISQLFEIYTEFKYNTLPLFWSDKVLEEHTNSGDSLGSATVSDVAYPISAIGELS